MAHHLTRIVGCGRRAPPGAPRTGISEMTTATRVGRSSSILAVLGNADFRLLWLAGGADNSGRWMEAVVMALLMLDIGGSALQVALLFAFRWTPMLLFALVSGMVADRANRRMVMIVARGVAVAVTAILLVLVASNEARPEHLFIGSLLLGWLYVLEFPSRRSFIYELVGGQQVVGAMSLETISTTIGRLLGPLAAGVLVGQAGFTVAFATLLALYSLAFLFVVLVRTRLPARSSDSYNLWGTAKTGFGYAFRSPVVRAVLMGTIIFNALAFSVESLFPVVAKEHLEVGPELTGVLISAQSFGTLGAALAIGLVPNLRYHGRVFCIGMAIQLVTLILFALSPWYPLSFVLLLFSGLGAAGFSTMQSTIIMLSSPPEIRGALLGVLGQCIGVAAVGGVIVGFVADYLSAQAAVALSTGLGLALLIPVMLFTPLIKSPITPAED